MYMILESIGIINLACYPSINVVEYKNAFLLCAFLELVPVASLDDRSLDWKTITLATYDNELDAHYCLWHLFHSLQSGKKSWDPADVQRPCDAWETTQSELLRTRLNIKHWVKNATLCYSGFYEWTIEYDQRMEERYPTISSADNEEVEDKLRNILDSELAKKVEIKWAPAEVFVLIEELENKANMSIYEIVNSIDPDNKLYSADHLTAEELYEIATQFDIGLTADRLLQ